LGTHLPTAVAARGTRNAHCAPARGRAFLPVALFARPFTPSTRCRCCPSPHAHARLFHFTRITRCTAIPLHYCLLFVLRRCASTLLCLAQGIPRELRIPFSRCNINGAPSPLTAPQPTSPSTGWPNRIPDGTPLLSGHSPSLPKGHTHAPARGSVDSQHVRFTVTV